MLSAPRSQGAAGGLAVVTMAAGSSVITRLDIAGGLEARGFATRCCGVDGVLLAPVRALLAQCLSSCFWPSGRMMRAAQRSG